MSEKQQHNKAPARDPVFSIKELILLAGLAMNFHGLYQMHQPVAFVVTGLLLIALVIGPYLVKRHEPS